MKSRKEMKNTRSERQVPLLRERWHVPEPCLMAPCLVFACLLSVGRSFASDVAIIPVEEISPPGAMARYEAVASVIDRAGGRVMPPDEALDRLYASGAESRSFSRGLLELERLVTQGEAKANELQMLLALDDLSRAEGMLDTLGPRVEDPRLFRRLAFLRGFVLHRTRQFDIAAEAFEQCASFDPDFEPSPTQYPPDLIDAYEASKARVRERPACSLRVESSPDGARVVIDGRALGTTPLDVAIPAGRHFLRVDRDGFHSKGIVMEGCPSDAIRMHLLARAAERTRAELAAADQAAIDRARRLLDVRTLLLVRRKEASGRDAIAYVACRGVTPEETSTCKEGELDAPEPSAASFAALQQVIRPLSPDEPVYRDPWFWTTVGVAAAAVALAVVLPVALSSEPTTTRYDVQTTQAPMHPTGIRF